MTVKVFIETAENQTVLAVSKAKIVEDKIVKEGAVEYKTRNNGIHLELPEEKEVYIYTYSVLVNGVVGRARRFFIVRYGRVNFINKLSAADAIKKMDAAKEIDAAVESPESKKKMRFNNTTQARLAIRLRQVMEKNERILIEIKEMKAELALYKREVSKEETRVNKVSLEITEIEDNDAKMFASISESIEDVRRQINAYHHQTKRAHIRVKAILGID